MLPWNGDAPPDSIGIIIVIAISCAIAIASRCWVASTTKSRITCETLVCYAGWTFLVYICAIITDRSAADRDILSRIHFQFICTTCFAILLALLFSGILSWRMRSFKFRHFVCSASPMIAVSLGYCYPADTGLAARIRTDQPVLEWPEDWKIFTVLPSSKKVLAINPANLQVDVLADLPAMGNSSRIYCDKTDATSRLVYVGADDSLDLVDAASLTEVVVIFPHRGDPSWPVERQLGDAARVPNSAIQWRASAGRSVGVHVESPDGVSRNYRMVSMWQSAQFRDVSMLMNRWVICQVLPNYIYAIDISHESVYFIGRGNSVAIGRVGPDR